MGQSLSAELFYGYTVTDEERLWEVEDDGSDNSGWVERILSLRWFLALRYW